MKNIKGKWEAKHWKLSQKWLASQVLDYFSFFLFSSFFSQRRETALFPEDNKQTSIVKPKMEKTNSTSSHLQSLLAFSFSFLALFHLTAHAQSLPPPKFDGFVYGNHSLDFNTIHIEAFFDPVCPDSRDSWPPLKKALDHYGSRVRLVIHLLPLPWVHSLLLLCVSALWFLLTALFYSTELFLF